MKNRLFTFKNCNADAMVVPQEQGGSDDDNYFASIGDATMKHIQGLADCDRVMWEDLIHMPDGSMFRTIPSLDMNDHDPRNLRGKNLNEYLAQYAGKVSTNELARIKEAIEVEQERRDKLMGPDDDFEESEDALDQDIIPYADWEKFPGFWNKVDIPSTPRDRFIYMGNTKESFYDELPKGHPNENVIRKYLNILNRPFPKDVDEGYAKWVCKQLDSENVCSYVRTSLKSLARTLVEDVDADEAVKIALNDIDNIWSKEFINKSVEKTLEQPMTRLILHKLKEWEKTFSNGFEVYGSVKTFGFTLFKNFRNEMTGWHWEQYRKAKTKYAPRIMLFDVDINRASIKELRKALGTKTGENIFFARPFEDLATVLDKGHIKSNHFANDSKSLALINFVEKHSKLALQELSLKRTKDVCSMLMKVHREKKNVFTSEQMAMVWKYYNATKIQISEAIDVAQEKESEKQHV